jgi:hypothetical protein
MFPPSYLLAHWSSCPQVTVTGRSSGPNYVFEAPPCLPSAKVGLTAVVGLERSAAGRPPPCLPILYPGSNRPEQLARFRTNREAELAVLALGDFVVRRLGRREPNANCE